MNGQLVHRGEVLKLRPARSVPLLTEGNPLAATSTHGFAMRAGSHFTPTGRCGDPEASISPGPEGR